MSLEDKDYIWVKVEPPWDSVAGLLTEHEQPESAHASNVVHVKSDSELGSNDNVCSVSEVSSREMERANGQTSLIDHAMKAEVDSDSVVGVWGGKAARVQAGLYIKEVKAEDASKCKKAYGVSSLAVQTGQYSKNEVKAETENDKGVSGVSTSANQTGLYIKDEVQKAKFERDKGMSGVTSAVQTGLYINNNVIAEAQTECKGGVSSSAIQTGECKDTEAESESEEHAYGISAAAARADLYLKHEVKDELVVGPEVFHRPKVPLAHTVSLNSADSSSIWDRSCSVRLERMDVDMDQRVCRIGHETLKFRLCQQENRTNMNLRRRKIGAVTTSLSTEKTLSHKNNHIKEKLHKCGQCSFTSAYKHYVRVHKKIAHTDEHKCNQSSFTTVHKKLKTHKNIHRRYKPYKCDQCNHACVTKFGLQDHKWVHSKDKPYRCEHCSYTSTRKHDLRVHSEIKHANETVYKCDQCNYVSAGKDKLQAHKKVHSFASASKKYLQTQEIRREKPFNCDQCNYDSVREDLLEMHKKVMHVREKPYKCDQCNFDSVREDLFEIHKKVMHVNEKAYKCDLCNYLCAREDRLIAHKMLHTEVNPYQCGQCSYVTTLKTNLRRHAKIHKPTKA